LAGKRSTPKPAAPKQPQAPKPAADRDATYDELLEYALSKGNTQKAAEQFAETNTNNPGYVVRNGALEFDKERFQEGKG
jgi:hypothetical protein